MPTKFTCKTTLLEAIARFAYASDDSGRLHLQQVRIGPDYFAATNGHRLAWVPVKSEYGAASIIQGEVGEPFLLPAELVRHHVAGVRSSWEEYEQPEFNGSDWLYRRKYISGAETEVTLDAEQVVSLKYQGITTSRRLTNKIEEYPPFDQIFEALTTEGTPALPRFDPKLLVGVNELLAASGDNSGVTMHAWEKEFGSIGPIEYRSQRGTRVILMGMAVNNEDAEKAREFQRKKEAERKAKKS